MISVERARELFSYDPHTGHLTWTSGPRSGLLAGRKRGDGYRIVYVDRHAHYVHRLAWMIATGTTPQFIDHIDGDRSNNCMANLRSCSRVENNRNMSMRKNNHSGVMGVYRAAWGSWIAQIKDHTGRTVHLGCFSSIEKAAEARSAAERLYGYHPNHGRPARTVKHDGPTHSGEVA